MQKPKLAALYAIVMLGLGVDGRAQSLPVLHLINGNGQSFATMINSTSNFVTSYKGSNDVTIRLLAGEVDANYVDLFGGVYAAGNPDYITSFVGLSGNGTGDGTVGDLEDMETSGGVSLQFDFAIPFGAGDILFIIDCDTAEAYQVQAYSRSGTNYLAASTVNWTAQNYAGSTEEAPNDTFPAWDSADGILRSRAPGGLNENLTVITPNQFVDRVVISQIAGGSTGSPDNNADIQFMQIGLGLGVTQNGSNANIYIPLTSSPVVLETTFDLNTPVWTPIATNAGPTNMTVTVSSKKEQFFRLKY